ncbi:MAG TPA: alpha-glucuronidase family glycosyl hydrolase, partial [Cyclobacteriaceae bacterium]|nr:alpha-glucuronidase family glycosyl hydrolase [Cyclobacteriaceae bacterium]
MTRFLSLILYLLLPFALRAEDGYRLWLRYDKIPDTRLVNQYKKELTTLSIQGQSPTLTIIRDELNRGLSGLLGYVPKPATGLTGLVIATINSPLIQSLNITTDPTLDEEGYVIRNITHSGKRLLVITAKTEVGLLYGTFHFLRLIQTRQSLQQRNIQSSPKIKVRILNHWDNLDGTVERGYAGFS